MEWGQVLTLMLGNFGIIWWFRKDSREDWIRWQNLLEGIRSDMKDFHEHRIKIEESRKNK